MRSYFPSNSFNLSPESTLAVYSAAFNSTHITGGQSGRHVLMVGNVRLELSIAGEVIRARGNSRLQSAFHASSKQSYEQLLPMSQDCCGPSRTSPTSTGGNDNWNWVTG